MKQIVHLSETIRAYTYKWTTEMYLQQYKSRPDEWNEICIAMDVLDDTCMALENYERCGLGSDNGEQYIRLYGFLQGIFLQQDSILRLYKAFTENQLDSSSDSAWAAIRDLRNLTVGHPIKRTNSQGVRRCFISRVTINSHGFQLRVWDKEKNVSKIETVDLRSLYERYKSEGVTYLQDIREALATRWGELSDAGT